MFLLHFQEIKKTHLENVILESKVNDLIKMPYERDPSLQWINEIIQMLRFPWTGRCLLFLCVCVFFCRFLSQIKMCIPNEQRFVIWFEMKWIYWISYAIPHFIANSKRQINFSITCTMSPIIMNLCTHKKPLVLSH